MQFSPAPSYFLPRKANFYPRHPTAKHSQSYVFPLVTKRHKKKHKRSLAPQKGLGCMELTGSP